MSNYTMSSNNNTINAFTLQANSANGFVGSFRFMDEGATLSARRYKLQRSTGGVTSVGASVEQSNTRTHATTDTAIAAWGTNPTLSGNPIVTLTYVCTTAASIPILNWNAPNPRYPVALIDSEQIDVVNTVISTLLVERMNWSQSAASPTAIRGRRQRSPGYYTSFCDSHFNAQGTVTVPRQSITNACLLVGADWQNTDDGQSSNQVFQNLLAVLIPDVGMFDMTPGTSIMWAEC